MLTMRDKRTISGFTLIEILVTIGLVILLLALVGYPILTGLAFMEKSVARADAQSAARLAIDAMTRELAEAMYVFDPPLGGMFVAFLPSRSAPQGAAPIEPEAIAIRYWRALRDPAYAYAPFYQTDADPVNPYYLARTEIEDPAARDDDWNDSAAALTRAVFWYPDGHTYVGETWPTAQPGYPWLEAVLQFGAGPPAPRAAYDFYRERAVGLTPNNADYDIPSVGFSPTRLTDEALVPWTGAFPRDYSRYRSRYPLWAHCAQWNPAGSDFAMMGEVKVYVGDPRVLTYQTGVDAVTGDVWVVRVADGTPIYNTGAYPLRDVNDPDQAEFAFGIDYDRGEVMFDFPAVDLITAAASMYIYDLEPVSSIVAYSPAVVRGSVTVWVEDPVTQEVAYYKQVEPPPNPVGSNTMGRNRFAVRGTQLIFDDNPAGPERPADGDLIHVRYRYRNNPEGQLVVATYGTKAVINIGITVSKRDRAARKPEASRQDVSLVAKVKLKNVPR
ncbi:MAG: type II secretion system protein [Armatimonadota bacterium]|nr:MAG: type II secretion system protein [Armatimonadota bacterium]